MLRRSRIGRIGIVGSSASSRRAFSNVSRSDVVLGRHARQPVARDRQSARVAVVVAREQIHQAVARSAPRRGGRGPPLPRSRGHVHLNHRPRRLATPRPAPAVQPQYRSGCASDRNDAASTNPIESSSPAFAGTPQTGETPPARACDPPSPKPRGAEIGARLVEHDLPAAAQFRRPRDAATSCSKSSSCRSCGASCARDASRCGVQDDATSTPSLGEAAQHGQRRSRAISIRRPHRAGDASECRSCRSGDVARRSIVFIASRRARLATQSPACSLAASNAYVTSASAASRSSADSRPCAFSAATSASSRSHARDRPRRRSSRRLRASSRRSPPRCARRVAHGRRGIVRAQPVADRHAAADQRVAHERRRLGQCRRRCALRPECPPAPCAASRLRVRRPPPRRPHMRIGAKPSLAKIVRHDHEQRALPVLEAAPPELRRRFRAARAARRPAPGAPSRRRRAPRPSRASQPLSSERLRRRRAADLQLDRRHRASPRRAVARARDARRAALRRASPRRPPAP